MRDNALGNYGEMLMAVSKSAAMLNFLNAKQNKKTSPNENFARELMELYTLGRDKGYTEIDIREAARALTGWNVTKSGEFRFQAKNHDNGEKTILGQTGNFRGEDVIRILLEQKQTAIHLTEKLVDFLICRKIDNASIEKFSNLFFESNYDISILVEAILTSDDFLSEESIGIRVKSPTELLVGLTRQFKIEYKNPDVILQIQRALNQMLFYPPNVGGWASGTGWIDSSTLMYRMNLASTLLNGGEIEWMNEALNDEEANLKLQRGKDARQAKIAKKVQAYPDWKFFHSDIHLVEGDLASFFIQTSEIVALNFNSSKRANQSTKDFVIGLLSLPEYQLC